ncbi:putative IgGFc-binding protein, partial [Apostichopus japonicus]
MNATCGLCGTYDGEPDNDFTTSDGTLTNSVEEFGSSWVVGSEECTVAPEPPEYPCNGSDRNTDAMRTCYFIIDKAGPFADCHFVDPTPFYESCLYDLCLMEPGEGGECDTAYQYAAACQQEGGQPGDWRTWADCPLPCPNNMIPSKCSSPCQPSCAEPDGGESCPFEDCLETCVCPEGMLLQVDHCVEIEECGCFDGVQYYQVGETYLNENCTEECICMEGNSLTCLAGLSCDVNQECSIQDGIRDCYCIEGYQPDNNGTCQEELYTTAPPTKMVTTL